MSWSLPCAAPIAFANHCLGLRKRNIYQCESAARTLAPSGYRATATRSVRCLGKCWQATGRDHPRGLKALESLGPMGGPFRSAARRALRLRLGMFGLDHAPSRAHTALAPQKSAGTTYGAA